jgi:hypothetical protein
MLPDAEIIAMKLQQPGIRIQDRGWPGLRIATHKALSFMQLVHYECHPNNHDATIVR